MRYFSMFSGVGGFELGIRQAHNKYARQCEESESEKCKQGRFGNSNEQGLQLCFGSESAPLCVGVCEIDKYASQLLSKRFEGVKNYGDATRINTDELPGFDLLVGGFPCQSFSIAGKRRGFDDTRGTLFFEVARVLEAKKPKNFVLENVKGLLSHDKGQTFRVIIDTLTELGYDVQWMVLNSKFFGVPQNRERVFIIGSLTGTSRPEILPLGQANVKGDSCFARKSEAASAGQSLQSEDRHSESSSRNTWQHPSFDENIRPDDKSLQEKRNKPDNSNYIRRASYSANSRIRRLTPLECERLQGFPDGWTEGFSDTQRYKMMGNAVTVNVVQAIMEKLFPLFEEKQAGVVKEK